MVDSLTVKSSVRLSGRQQEVRFQKGFLVTAQKPVNILHFKT